MAEFIGTRELHRRYGTDRSLPAFRTWLCREEKVGRFVKRVHLSPRCVAWRVSELEAWERARLAEREKAAERQPKAA